MWCSDCQLEVRPQGQGTASPRCPRCGTQLSATALRRPSETIRQAREILERWQSTDLFDRIAATGPLNRLSTERFPAAVTAEHVRTASNLPPSRPVEEPSEHQDRSRNEAAVQAATLSVAALVQSAPLLAATAPDFSPQSIPDSAPMVGVLLPGVEESALGTPTVAIATEPAAATPAPDPFPSLPTAEQQQARDSAPPTAVSDSSGAPENFAQMEPIPVNEASTVVPQVTANPLSPTSSPVSVQPNKPSRAPLRRPPLQRRFRMEKPSASDNLPGSRPVNRNLRVDQPGGDGTRPQPERTPVTSLPSSVAPETRIVANSPPAGRRLRIDGSTSVEEVTGTDGFRTRTQGRARQRMIDEAHGTRLLGPHFEVSSPKRSNLTTLTGQFLAYLGVLGLTIGTAIVIYGHFGGYSEYTPTGWLVTTVAQMLLFLGVINLVSGGIEQTNDDVSRRINSLGEQLMRIEQVTSDVMRGPKMNAGVWTEGEDTESATRERATETAPK